mgnify:CR=1 FL=1
MQTVCRGEVEKGADMSKVTDCVAISVAQPNDGVYPGTWGGYVVRFTADGITYQAKSECGIRTMAAPCKVTVEQGEMIVEAD